VVKAGERAVDERIFGVYLRPRRKAFSQEASEAQKNEKSIRGMPRDV